MCLQKLYVSVLRMCLNPLGCYDRSPETGCSSLTLLGTGKSKAEAPADSGHLVRDASWLIRNCLFAESSCGGRARELGQGWEESIL